MHVLTVPRHTAWRVAAGGAGARGGSRAVARYQQPYQLARWLSRLQTRAAAAVEAARAAAAAATSVQAVQALQQQRRHCSRPGCVDHHSSSRSQGLLHRV